MITLADDPELRFKTNEIANIDFVNYTQNLFNAITILLYKM